MGGGEPSSGGVPPPTGGILALLQDLVDFIKSLWDRGKSTFAIDVITLVTGATFQRLYAYTRPVRSSIIQNISTEVVTLVSNENGTASRGIILNPAAVGGEAGGSTPTGNIDLSKIWFVRTTAGVTLAVQIEE